MKDALKLLELPAWLGRTLLALLRLDAQVHDNRLISPEAAIDLASSVEHSAHIDPAALMLQQHHVLQIPDGRQNRIQPALRATLYLRGAAHARQVAYRDKLHHPVVQILA